jgi:hypothetical protein
MNRDSYCPIYVLMLALSLLTDFCHASTLAEKYPSLAMHGERYTNSCNPSSQGLLRETLVRNKVKNSKQAWRLIGAILCFPNDANNHVYLKQFSNKRMRLTVESTGEDPDVQTVELNDELLDEIIAGGNAWKASLRVESGKIVLQYFANEACVEGATLLFHRGAWSIHEFGIACD